MKAVPRPTVEDGLEGREVNDVETGKRGEDETAVTRLHCLDLETKSNPRVYRIFLIVPNL